MVHLSKAFVCLASILAAGAVAACSSPAEEGPAEAHSALVGPPQVDAGPYNPGPFACGPLGLVCDGTTTYCNETESLIPIGGPVVDPIHPVPPLPVFACKALPPACATIHACACLINLDEGETRLLRCTDDGGDFTALSMSIPLGGPLSE